MSKMIKISDFLTRYKNPAQALIAINKTRSMIGIKLYSEATFHRATKDTENSFIVNESGVFYVYKRK